MAPYGGDLWTPVPCRFATRFGPVLAQLTGTQHVNFSRMPLSTARADATDDRTEAMTAATEKVVAHTGTSEPDTRAAQGREQMQANLQQYLHNATLAEKAWKRGDAGTAAIYASLAAWVAAHSHCGFFTSPRLEALLTDIGQSDLRNQPVLASRPATHKRVLHVTGEVSSVGGLANMLRRWIECDPSRTHSVALTQQRNAVAPALIDAVKAAGGGIHRINREPGGLIGSARALRRLALEHDIVVLHTANSDVIPSLAFARPECFPPVFYLNHSDHMFWLGASIAQVVGSMRKAALDIAEQRRGIARERSMLVPILVSPARRQTSREAAREKLGIAADTVLMISVARHQKYRTIDGLSFADVHVPVLKKHPEARLYVVGGGDRPDWQAASDEVGGRIKSLPAQNPKLWFEAADIYVDSFPFCSATSMMEAAGHNLPCAGRFLWPDAARICGMDHPGLQGPLLEGRSNAEYQAHLTRLISDPALRADAGARIAKSVAAANEPPGWNAYMEAAFARCAELPPVKPADVFGGQPGETVQMGEPDIRLQQVYGFTSGQDELVRWHLTWFPTRERLRLWWQIRRGIGFTGRGAAIRSLLPEWLIRRTRDRAQ